MKKDIGDILRQLCERKGVDIIEAEACKDHIPLKYIYLEDFEEMVDVKLLIYGLRRYLTANLLAKIKAYTVRLEDIYKYYPNTTL